VIALDREGMATCLRMPIVMPCFDGSAYAQLSPQAAGQESLL
jgi:hypothetical protein